MARTVQKNPAWRFRALSTGYERVAPLEAYWEVSLDPVSDDYTPDAISASELLYGWAKDVRKKYPNELIPIHWFAQSREEGVFALMAFQFLHLKKQAEALGEEGRKMMRENFLTIFTWPVDPITGEQLNWLTLPVVDKLWNSKRADKGGFIQQATGWKPAILQPYVYLPSLFSAFATR